MRFTIAELIVAVAVAGVACVWPVLWVPVIVVGLSLFLATKSRAVGLALAVVAECLYLPFGWLLWTDSWSDYRLFWLNLWPVLPGFVIGLWLFHPHDVLEFSTMGSTTLVLLVALICLARAVDGGWSRRRPLP